MKNATLQICLPVLGGVLLSAVACFSVAAAESPSATPAPTPVSPPRVRVMVTENILASTAGTAPGASPAPKTGGAGAATPAAAAKAAAIAAAADTFTRTTKKSLTVTVVNLTTASMEVNVKANFLGKDEAGKHEVVTEKTVEKQLTLEPNRPQSFTTEEVDFTHTAAHRLPSKPPGGNGKGRVVPVSPMEPASGHAYYGYKVDVYQGPDYVGTAHSETH